MRKKKIWAKKRDFFWDFGFFDWGNSTFVLFCRGNSHILAPVEAQIRVISSNSKHLWAHIPNPVEPQITVISAHFKHLWAQ